MFEQTQYQKVFVTGALGFVGRAILARYRKLGAETSGLDLQADPTAGIVSGDVSYPEAWQKTIDGCALVIHTAAIVTNNVARSDAWRVNVLGTRCVLDAAIKAGAQRFVHISSLAAMRYILEDQADETAPVMPTGNPYVDTKIASEQVVLAAHAAGEIHCTIIRPADASETADAWRQSVKTMDGPVALILSRQKLPVIKPNQSEYGLANGAYIFSDSKGKPDIILIATGSEVYIAIEAQRILANEGVAARVVSMPSWELFEKTSQDYQDHVLLPNVTARLAIEAGVPLGWERYVGRSDAVIGITGFGASAPGGTMMEKFGFTPENIAKKAREILNK